MKRRQRRDFALARIANLRKNALKCPDCRVRREAFDLAAGAEIALAHRWFEDCARFCVQGEIAIAMEAEARRR